MPAENTGDRAPYAAFLESDSVALQTQGSKRRFQIHEALLALKAKAIHVAFEGHFKEQEELRIIFQDTTDDTVVRFLEWAYTGDYSTEIYLETPIVTSSRVKRSDMASKREESVPEEPSAADGALAIDEQAEDYLAEDAAAAEAMPEKPVEADEATPAKDPVADPVMDVAKDEDLGETNHPLSRHALVYIFAEMWDILPLKSLAYGKLTANIAGLGKPEDLNSQLAVIELLEMAFTNLPASDGLLDWLGKYAAWCVGQLRLLKSFEALMHLVGPAMLPYVNAAPYAPWESSSSSLTLPRKKEKRRATRF